MWFHSNLRVIRGERSLGWLDLEGVLRGDVKRCKLLEIGIYEMYRPDSNGLW
jgi:hypothetical protein